MTGRGGRGGGRVGIGRGGVGRGGQRGPPPSVEPH